jgi:hypothetical protein
MKENEFVLGHSSLLRKSVALAIIYLSACDVLAGSLRPGRAAVLSKQRESSGIASVIAQQLDYGRVCMCSRKFRGSAF